MGLNPLTNKLDITPSNSLDTDRRKLITLLSLTAGIGIIAGIPLSTYFLAPAMKKQAGRWIDFGPAANLKKGGVEMLSYEFMVRDGWQVLPQRGFVWAKSDVNGTITVFSSTCTHLACRVIWQKESNRFECPCHSGRFNPEGIPIAGPPTRPLVVLNHRIEDNNLKVYLGL